MADAVIEAFIGTLPGETVAEVLAKLATLLADPV
jgi:hypothetical protein